MATGNTAVVARIETHTGARKALKSFLGRYFYFCSSDEGFCDAVNPISDSVGHRRLVLDQSMIMGALDNSINHGAMQRQFLTATPLPGLDCSIRPMKDVGSLGKAEVVGGACPS